MFKEVKYSLSTLIGTRYMENVAKANAFFGKMSYDEAMAIANEEVVFYSAEAQAKNDALLDLVGTQVVEPMLPDDNDGAPTNAFRKAEDKSAAPLGGFGCFRLGEDGKLYLIGKSEHYHASLGHAFAGYKLIDNARKLGILNATHNNTRGYVTRLHERRIVEAANGILPGNDEATDAIIASTEKGVLNRVINLETGSLAVEAGVKMMLARFYQLSPELDAPKYKGRTPVFFIMADKADGITGNYHGTTVLTQTFRGLWEDFREKADAADMWKVVSVRPNDVEDFKQKLEKYNTGKYKTAGFLHEIIMMNYGATKLEPEYLRAVYDLCHAYDTPTLCDEIQTGIWHGSLLLFRRYGLNPDFAIIGKGFPGGEYPASRIITTAEYDNLNQFGALVTNGQEELAALAYLITIRFVQEIGDELDKNSALFENGFAALCEKYPEKLAGYQGLGCNIALHFHSVEDAAKFTKELHVKCIDASAQLYKPNCVPGVIFKPPVVSTEATIRKILSVLDEILAR
ncbi:MAG: aminotransferase class III-fold pyridoxal phosphate-dependent enzyme [Clostridia bacterium]|nr:aminotransferase class III-fold pyridoxal phosphate-dependent enzyme [Clostridia bacterium]